MVTQAAFVGQIGNLRRIGNPPALDSRDALRWRRLRTVPLYDLVYHDAVVTTGGGSGNLRGTLYGWATGMGGRGGTTTNPDQVRKLAALHGRIALLEMTNHEFLNKARRKERTTFADGTTITVDWDANTIDIKP